MEELMQNAKDVLAQIDAILGLIGLIAGAVVAGIKWFQENREKKINEILIESIEERSRDEWYPFARDVKRSVYQKSQARGLSKAVGNRVEKVAKKRA